MEGAVEVDSNYRNIAASWFPELNVSTSKKAADTKEQSSESSTDNIKKRKHAENSEDIKVTKKTKSQPLISNFVGEKLKKKLAKGDRKRRHKEEEDKSGQVHVIPVENYDDSKESKTSLIQNLKRSKHNLPSNDNCQDKITQLEEKIRNPTISKNARKKLRKKLNQLLKDVENKNALPESTESPTETKQENNEKLDTESDNMTVNMVTETDSSENTIFTKLTKSRRRKDSTDESPPVQRESKTKSETQLEESTDQSQQIHSQEEHKIKRKKNKKRSKQKNIKKDNRPDHLKPPHLRKLKTATTNE